MKNLSQQIQDALDKCDEIQEIVNTIRTLAQGAQIKTWSDADPNYTNTLAIYSQLKADLSTKVGELP